MITYKSRLLRYDIVPVLEDDSLPRCKITSSKDSVDVITKFYDSGCMVKEISYALYMNRSNNTIGVYEVSKGGVTGTVIDTLLITKIAIELLAKSVILFHNHPSGNKQPSEQDRQMTNKIKESLKLFDISLLDHIIILPDIREKWGTYKPDYYSFADEGLI